MEETFPNKKNSKKTNKRRKKLDLLNSRHWNPKQAITLKHLIAYNNIRMYIKLKNVP
jgi:hypothetical protein